VTPATVFRDMVDDCAASIAAGAALELVDVWTSYADNPVLLGVSFAVPPARISVLLGASGVGKTTCLRHLCGLLMPDHGEVRVEGRSLFTLRKAELARLRRRFGVLLEGDGLYGSALWASMTVLDNVRFQLAALTDLDEDAVHRRAHERLDELGLGRFSDERPLALSAGMRRRVGLARALASDPEFAVLDGPDLGVDPVRVRMLCDVIRRHQSARGATYVVVTQDMEVARQIADHVIVLVDGRVAIEGPPRDVFATRHASAAQLLSGSRHGPMRLADQHVPPRPAPADSTHFDLPLWLAGVGLLAAMSGATIGVAVIVGQSVNPVELAGVALVWLVALAVMLRR